MSDGALLDGVIAYLRSVSFPEMRLERLIEMNPGISKKVIEAARKKMDMKPVAKQIDVPSATDSHDS